MRTGGEKIRTFGALLNVSRRVLDCGALSSVWAVGSKQLAIQDARDEEFATPNKKLCVRVIAAG
jgi:hypothetical protein